MEALNDNLNENSTSLEAVSSSPLPILFKLEQAEFEGPLDLMLHLIAKHKLNIYDIEIFSLVEQYMAFISEFKKNNMELAGEFIEMASRLVYIKSVMLLPRHEEEKEILKRELEGQLIEYSLCKTVSKILEGLNIGTEVFDFKGEELPKDLSYRAVHKSISLLEAYLSVSTKKQNFEKIRETALAPIIEARVVSVRSRAVFILNILYKTKRAHLDDVFLKCENRSELVATFLAVLELIKTKRVSISDDYYIKQGINEAALEEGENIGEEYSYK